MRINIDRKVSMSIDNVLDRQSLDAMADRILDEQIECVRKYGNHGLTPILRERVLESLRIPKPRQKAESLIMRIPTCSRASSTS